MMRYLILLALMLCLPVRGEAWQVVGGGDANVFLRDTFTESIQNVDISSHLPEVGGAWSKLGIVANQLFYVYTTGALANSSTGGDIALNSADPPGSDYTVTVVGTPGSSLNDRGFGPCVRVQTDKSAYCAFVTGIGRFQIARYAAGETNPYGTEALAEAYYTLPDTSAYYTVSISISGSSISATIEDLGTISASNSTISAAGKAGVVIRRSASIVSSIEAK